VTSVSDNSRVGVLVRSSVTVRVTEDAKVDVTDAVIVTTASERVKERDTVTPPLGLPALRLNVVEKSSDIVTVCDQIVRVSDDDRSSVADTVRVGSRDMDPVPSPFVGDTLVVIRCVSVITIIVLVGVLVTSLVTLNDTVLLRRSVRVSDTVTFHVEVSVRLFGFVNDSEAV